jgi:uncharacterized NAD(P)/FAD-binding protein YdhS
MYRPGQPLRIAIIGGGLDSVDFLDGAEFPLTAPGLLRFTRSSIGECAENADWQSVMDAFRTILRRVWSTLPAEGVVELPIVLCRFGECIGFAFGPVTRGTFGEMTGASDITRQIEFAVGRMPYAHTSWELNDPLQVR